MRTTILILLIPLLTGCIAGKEQYDSYLAAQQARDQQQAVEAQARHERWQRMAEACAGDAACIQSVAREATLSDAFASVASAGGAGSSRIEQFHVQAHPMTTALTSIAAATLPQAIQGAVQIRQSDNNAAVSIADIGARADMSRAAFALGEAAVNGTAGAVTGIAGILPALPPSISAGGSIYQGQTQVGDNVGRDNVRDGSRVGDDTRIRLGPINTGTQNTGGVIGAGQIGSGRQNAPGPFGNIGPRCEGPLCQTVLPPPAPEGGE